MSQSYLSEAGDPVPRAATRSGRPGAMLLRRTSGRGAGQVTGERGSATEPVQADHVHPHSHRGATTVANAQALSARHNERKGNRIPWAWELERLARRRTEGMAATLMRRG